MKCLYASVRILLFAFPVIGIIACNDSLTSTTDDQENAWLIPKNEVRDGGPGKDGIPALTNPELIEAGQADYLDRRELIVGIVVGGEARAYPHEILDWHEIINDQFGEDLVAVTYCPLTGTGIGWEREYDGRMTEFGVSGLLYNTNLMPYDRTTNSTWSQQGLLCVNGDLVGEEARTIQVIETEWSTWKRFFPNTRVVSRNTGYSRSYGLYPYGNYKSTTELIFPVSEWDDRLHPKERVHAILVSGKVKAYRFESFKNRGIIIDEIDGRKVLLIGSDKQNFIVSYFIDEIDGQELQFLFSSDVGPGPYFSTSVALNDQLGNAWDILGHAVAGPNKGHQLEPTRSFMGYWFSFAPFYAEPEIYDE